MCPAGVWPRNGWAVAEVVADQVGVVSGQAKRVRRIYLRLEVDVQELLHHQRYHGHVCTCTHSHRCQR